MLAGLVMIQNVWEPQIQRDTETRNLVCAKLSNFIQNGGYGTRYYYGFPKPIAGSNSYHHHRKCVQSLGVDLKIIVSFIISNGIFKVII